MAVKVSACASPAPAPPLSPSEASVIAYTVSPEISEAGAIGALRVSVSFAVDADGSTDLYLPSQRAGREELWRNFGDIAIDGGQLAATDKPYVWTVSAEPGSHVTVSYVAKSSIAHAPTATDGQPFAPWIMPDWVFVDTVGLIARPDLPRATPATFAWRDDSGLVMVSDLERHSTTASGATMQDMRRGVIFAGRDIRVLSRGPVRLGLRGDFPHADDVMLDGIARVLAAIRSYWGEDVNEPFTVAIAALPIDTGSRGGFSGASLDDGFLATVSGDVDLSRLLSMLFAHEVLHKWIPATLGDPRVSYGAGWFGEGFTDYYARALMLRAGVISLEEYARLWNGELAAYAASPARNFSNAALSENEWDDFDSSRMPYMRGAILAAMWDRQLRDLSGGAASLDDVVHDMRRRTSELPPGSAPNPAYGLRELFATVARDHGLDVTTDLQAYVDRGETVQLAPGAFGPCFRVELAGEAGGLPQKLILVPDVPQGPAACGLD